MFHPGEQGAGHFRNGLGLVAGGGVGGDEFEHRGETMSGGEAVSNDGTIAAEGSGGELAEKLSKTRSELHTLPAPAAS